MEFIFPTYYTILPAYIRYNKLPSNFEKILFSEIIFLSKNHKCYAKNNYFASLYNVKEQTVRRAIANLEKFNLLKRIKYKQSRYLLININKMEFIFPTYYTILPAYIRYNKLFSNFEKILFSEIIFLSKNHKCHAKNNYFASLYNVKEQTVRRVLANLEKFNLLKRIKYKQTRYLLILPNISS